MLTMLAGGVAVIVVLLTGRLGPSALARAPRRRCGLTGIDLLLGFCLFLLGVALVEAVLEAMGLQGEPLSARQHATRALLAQAIDYCSDHKINGLCIYYLIDSKIGGLSTAQEVCRYARHSNVRIILGVATMSSYHGFAASPDFDFTFKHWTTERPALRISARIPPSLRP